MPSRRSISCRLNRRVEARSTAAGLGPPDREEQSGQEHQSPARDGRHPRHVPGGSAAVQPCCGDDRTTGRIESARRGDWTGSLQTRQDRGQPLDDLEGPEAFRNGEPPTRSEQLPNHRREDPKLVQGTQAAAGCSWARIRNSSSRSRSADTCDNGRGRAEQIHGRRRDGEPQFRGDSDCAPSAIGS
jgi:hypothetical protein